MTYPLVQFVDRPAVDAVVRFDFNAAGVWADDRTWPKHEGFSIGVPQFEGDPDGIGVAYGLRNLMFNQVITGSDMAAARVISALSRELLRDTNWLLFQKSAESKPVWFKTYTSQPGELDFTQVRNDREGNSRWGLGVTLAAAPFAYGARETLATITIPNDPALGVSVPLPNIKGDAPTMLRISVNPSNRGAVNGWRWMHHLHAGATAATPIVWQIGTGDSWTLGTDTGAPVANTAYSGGSYRPVNFATDPGLVDRISGTAPSVVPNGRYKVLARIARSDTDTTFAVRFGQFLFFAYSYGDTAHMTREPSATGGHATWVDLGEFTFPRGTNAPAGEGGNPIAPNIAVQVQRLTGAGSAHLDAVMLLPVELDDTTLARTLVTALPIMGIFDPAGVDIWDGNAEAIWKVTATGDSAPSLVEPAGQFLAADPGQQNVLTALQQVNPGGFSGYDNTDDIAATTDIDISYHPMLLYLAGD